MKLPLVFVHIWEQLCVPSLHSSISERMEMKNDSLVCKYKYTIIHNVYLCISVQSMHECTSVIMYLRLIVLYASMNAKNCFCIPLQVAPSNSSS